MLPPSLSMPASSHTQGHVHRKLFLPLIRTHFTGHEVIEFYFGTYASITHPNFLPTHLPAFLIGSDRATSTDRIEQDLRRLEQQNKFANKQVRQAFTDLLEKTYTEAEEVRCIQCVCTAMYSLQSSVMHSSCFR